MLKETMEKYLTDERYFDKLVANMAGHEDDFLYGWMELRRSIDQLTKQNYLNLYRKEAGLYFSLEGEPICIAAFAGNKSAVDFLIRMGALDMEDDCITVSSSQWGELMGIPGNGIGNSFYCSKVKNENGTYHFMADHLLLLDPISFTFPEGNLECLKLFLEAGVSCDFRKRNHLRMLALCRDRSFWEYLLENNLLDPRILLIAAEYANDFRNYEIAKWLYSVSNI